MANNAADTSVPLIDDFGSQLWSLLGVSGSTTPRKDVTPRQVC